MSAPREVWRDRLPTDRLPTADEVWSAWRAQQEERELWALEHRIAAQWGGCAAAGPAGDMAACEGAVLPAGLSLEDAV